MESILYDQFGHIELDHWWWFGRRALVLKILESLNYSSDRPRVLDFGCGTGALLAELPGKFEGFGIDTAPQAILESRKRGLTNVLQSQPGDMPYSDHYFDAVLMLDVLEHLDSESLILTKIGRALKKEGYLIVTVPAYGWLWTRWDDLNFHKRRYVKERLVNVLTEAGFSVSFCSYMNFLLFPLAFARWMVEKMSLTKKGALPMGADVPPRLVNSVFKKIFSAEQAYLLRNKKFPWGSSLVAIAKRG